MSKVEPMKDPKNLFADYVFESKDLASMFSTEEARAAFASDAQVWVKIPAGAFGNGSPLTSLEVAQDYLVPVSGALIELWFGETSAAIEAGHLVGRFGITTLEQGVLPNRAAMRGAKFQADGLSVLSAMDVALLMEFEGAQDGSKLTLGAAYQEDDIFISSPSAIPHLQAELDQSAKPRRRWV